MPDKVTMLMDIQRHAVIHKPKPNQHRKQLTKYTARCSRIPLKKLTVAQPNMVFPEYDRIQRFITALTTTHQTATRPFHFLKIHFNITLLFMLNSSTSRHSFTIHDHSFSMHLASNTRYMPTPSHCP